MSRPFVSQITLSVLIFDLNALILKLQNEYTATIMLMVDDQIFMTSFDESDEGILEADAGSYSCWLAASRSVCDVSFRRFDLIFSLEKQLSLLCVRTCACAHVCAC